MAELMERDARATRLELLCRLQDTAIAAFSFGPHTVERQRSLTRAQGQPAPLGDQGLPLTRLAFLDVNPDDRRRLQDEARAVNPAARFDPPPQPLVLGELAAEIRRIAGLDLLDADSSAAG